MYARIRSYFSNTDMANQGLPEGKELALLEPYKNQLDPRIFTEQWEPPNTGGTQAGLRKNLRKASQLLKEAGWVAKNGTLYRDGKPFTISFLLNDPTQEATFSPFIENMKLLGIDAKIEIVDATTFWPKVFSYDWDMLQNGLFPHSLYPGTEFRTYWGSEAAENAMSFNQQYIKNPVVDELIEKIVAASDRENKVIASRALDRVLLYGYHSIPLYFWNKSLLAYWDRFEFPNTLPEWASFFPQDCWWIDPDKDAAVAAFRGSM